MAQSEIKKMKQGMSYSCKEKTIILNVFKYFRLLFPDKCVTEIVRRTAKATGCSEKSIFQFRKEEASVEGFKVPSTTKIRKNININSRDIKYDNSVRQAIRNIIYDLKYRNIVPSLNTILKQINGDAQLPNFSLMTLRRLMFDMGFSYEKMGNKSVLVEKPATINTKTNKKISQKQQNPRQQSSMVVTAVSSSSSVNVPQMSQQNSVPASVPTQLNVNVVNSMNQPRQEPPHLYIPSQNDNTQLANSHMNHHHYNMPVMFNHHHHLGPNNVNMHLKHDMPPWMHCPPPHALMKQE